MIQFIRKWDSRPTPKLHSVEEAVAVVLDPCNEGGELEHLRRRVEAHEQFIAQLVSVLHKRGSLTDKDVTSMVRYYFEVKS